jgi:transposase
MRMSLGVDLHKTQFTYCCLSEDRAVDGFGRELTNKEGYDSFIGLIHLFKEQGYEVKVAIESTGNARFFRNKILSTGVEVKVVNTLKFKVVNESVKKTDRHDARTLAEFLEKDMLPESKLCSQDSEDIRRILKSRSILVKAVVSLKNQVHGMLLSYGIESRRGQLQSKKERQRILNGLSDHNLYGNAAQTVKPLLDTIDQLYAEVKKLESVLEELVAEDEDVKILTTIPGVGLITSAAIRAYVDDIGRYDTAKKFSAHCGLVPWVQNSNMTIHHGRITKRGPVELRTALVQVVLGMVRAKNYTCDYRIITKYDSMKKYKGSGQSIIATARKMSTIIYHMLKFREDFDPLKMKYSQKYLEMQVAALEAVKAS